MEWVNGTRQKDRQAKRKKYPLWYVKGENKQYIINLWESKWFNYNRRWGIRNKGKNNIANYY